MNISDLIAMNSRRHSVKVAAFSKSGSAQLYARGNTPLTMEQIRNVTPSVFAEQKHHSRSARYSYIPTSEILSNLQREGFEPFAAFQGGSRDDEKKGFTKHLIRLRYMGEQALAHPTDHTVSEIVLMNSHDGTSSYRMMGGQFRMVCSNGLIIADGTMQEIRVKHTGDVSREVIDGCITILENAPRAAQSIQEMREISLSEPEQAIFSRAAPSSVTMTPPLPPSHRKSSLPPTGAKIPRPTSGAR